MVEDKKGLERLLALMFQAHPWHGIPAGEDAPGVVNAYIEIVPTDTTFEAASSTAGWSCANGSLAGTSCTLGGRSSYTAH